MPHAIIERNGVRVEGDFSVRDLMEILGIHNVALSRAAAAMESVNTPRLFETTAYTSAGPGPRYQAFLGNISDRGRSFVNILRQHPSGIEANALAAELGFQKTSQIGGLTGGGLSPLAKKHGIEISKVYRTEITKVDGQRRLTFYPGDLLLNEKPAA